MPLSGTTLFRSFVSTVKRTGETGIPDYSILFWQNTDNWAANQATHGPSPSNNTATGRYFRQYEIGMPSRSDVNDNNLGNINHLIRCVSTSTGWKSKCDIKYGASTSALSTFNTLLEIGGAHQTTSTLLAGRGSNFPALKNDGNVAGVANATGSNKVLVFNTAHGGHTHYVEGFRDELLKLKPGNTEKTSTGLTKALTVFGTTPIFKDPALNSGPLKTLPKDILVFYDGADDLPAEYYSPDPFVNSSTGSDAAGTYLPLAGMPNNGPYAYTVGMTPAEGDSVGLVHMEALSTMGGQHNHYTPTFPASYNAPTGGNMDVITDLTAIPSSAGLTAQADNSNFPVLHNHRVNWRLFVDLKSVAMKAYFTKSASTPILPGVIIGYSIGKYSGYNGSLDGAETLPPDWYFCDGNNGTPDLRDFYVLAKPASEGGTSEVLAEFNRAQVIDVSASTVDWKHSHVGTTKVAVTDGNPGFKDVGSHTEVYSSTATRHTHAVSTLNQFDTTPATTRRINVKVGLIVEYVPPTVDIAFIMYNPPTVI